VEPQAEKSSGIILLKDKDDSPETLEQDEPMPWSALARNNTL
jgi:hypothetical protein